MVAGAWFTIYLLPLQVGDELHKKEHLFDSEFRGIIESVEKVENIDY